MKVSIRKIGNSSGVILPQSMLYLSGIHDEAELSLEKGAIVLRKPRRGTRAGWDDAARDLVASGDDALDGGKFR